jgi:hypothetical protein
VRRFRKKLFVRQISALGCVKIWCLPWLAVTFYISHGMFTGDGGLGVARRGMRYKGTSGLVAIHGR